MLRWRLFYVYAALMYVYALCWALGIRQSAFFRLCPRTYNTIQKVQLIAYTSKVKYRHVIFSMSRTAITAQQKRGGSISRKEH